MLNCAHTLAASHWARPHALGPRPIPRAVGILACLLAAAIPNDAFVALADNGTRSPSFVVGLAFTAACALIVPNIVRCGCRTGLLWLFAVAFGLAAVIMTIDVATGYARPPEHSHADKPFKLLLMALLLTTVFEDRRWRDAVVPSYMAGWWIFIATSVAQLATGSHVVSEHYQVERISILGMNENGQAVMAASGIVLLVARAFGRIRPWDLMVLAVGTLAGGLIFAVGNSRTALAALVAGLASVLLAEFRSAGPYRKGLGRRVTRFALVTALAAGIFLTAGTRVALLATALTSLGARITAAVEGDDRGQRDFLASKTLALIRDNPLGIGSDRTIEVLGEDPHNDILKIIAEGGVIAGAALATALALLARRCWRLSAIPGESAAIGGLTVFGTTAIAGQGLRDTGFWLFFAVATTLAPRTARAVPWQRRAGAVSTGAPSSRRAISP
jgi:hypothetical protein